MTNFPESHRDLLDGQVASLATIGSNGFPQVTEVWFLHDDRELKLSLNDSRLKTRNLQKRSQCSLLLLDLENPYRYLEVRGTARIEPDDDYYVREEGGRQVRRRPQGARPARPEPGGGHDRAGQHLRRRHGRCLLGSQRCVSAASCGRSAP
jgi:PPOX class probable F420-dependent enzyme